MVREAGFHDSSVSELAIVWRMTSIDSLLAAFRDYANMDAVPDNVRSAIEATMREKSRAYECGGVLTIPNPAILASAIK